MKHTVCRAIRFEVDVDTNKMYLIFEVLDEEFKAQIYKEWNKDEDLELDGKELKRIT